MSGRRCLTVLTVSTDLTDLAVLAVLAGGVAGVMLSIDVAVLLAVVIFFLWRRRVQARSRLDTGLTMAVVLVFGILVAPTDFGQGIQNVVGNLAQGISDSGSP
ncbi:hypothetical protein AB0B50_41655 [Streptomyces sp. NPDC041068]|uniref:hypothetical protein n=1 Tax=Streptomyces sp. NPDC041068 TaxID=3155130 RepID=UPI0034023949